MAAASLPQHDNRTAGRISRAWLAGIIVVAAAFLLPTVANAQADTAATTTSNYVPSTTAGERSLDVEAFSPVCIANAPYIQYSIKPIGFTSSGPATLTFFDVNGNLVETMTVSSLSGTVIYPGASVDANGNATDWPGWKQASNGDWIPDDSDAVLRHGLTVTVEVNPTATASVSYASVGSGCADPPNGIPPTTTVCVPNGTSDPNCTLPRTGSNGGGMIMTIGGIALAAGIGITVLARRRRGAAPA